MKHTLSILLLLTGLSCFAQRRSYVQIGPAAYMSTKGSEGYFGGGLGCGSSKGIGGIGINMELVAREKQVVLPVYADFRCYFGSRLTSVYVTLQPGYNFRNNPTVTDANITIKDKGGFYAGIGAGYYVTARKVPGLNMQLKYVFMQDKQSASHQYFQTVRNTHTRYLSLCVFLVI